MSADHAAGTDPMSPTRAGRVDEACDRFEAAWKAGRRPRIEDHLDGAGGSEVPDLLRELLALELELRRRQGERPAVRTYRERFPGQARLVEDVFVLSGLADGPTDLPTPPDPGAGDVGDPAVPATLSDLPTARAGEGDGRAARSHDGEPDPQGPRFRILRPHARGGLGEVFVAEDRELHREVALKEIQGRHSHDSGSRARFVLEARITGNLEHPGIIPVYGLGHYPDGRPYYAMRFIRGDSLKDAIERFHRDEAPGRDPGERALAFRDLLGRFIDVCNAVAYAHSRGVLHRDLKPGNVMLGPYGETLVVDWGLAKPVGKAGVDGDPAESALRTPSAGGSSPTAAGSVIGTPAYMSPEQAAGDLDRLGPAADVYSLGATFYCLLTGRAAVEGQGVGEVLRRVRRGEFPPPRQAGRSVPPALEAVCLKAMALRPEDRYASPRDLADEIEHWLADEPVVAYREPWPVRLGRWARRHRPLVAGAAGLLLATAVALAVGAALLGRANGRIHAEWLRAEANFRDARDQRNRAEANLDRAEKNFQMARDAVDRYFTRISEDRLLNEPHMARLRRDLLSTAREFHQRFVAERKDDPRAEADLGKSHLRLSKIASALGDSKDARAQGEQARSIFARLAEAHPDVADYRHELGRSHSNLGYLDMVAGHSKESEAALRRALEVQGKLVDEHPDVADYQHERAASRQRLGSVYRDNGRVPEAEAELQRALKDMEGLVARHPDDARYRRELAGGHHNLGLLYQSNLKTKEAEARYERALGLWRKLADDDPEGTDYRRFLAWTCNNLGNLYDGTGRSALAERSHREALELRRKLVAEHPEVTLHRNDLAASYNNLGNLYLFSARLPEADAAYRGAVETRERLAADHPEQLSFAVELGAIQGNLGNLKKVEGEFEPARDWYGRAIATLEAVLGPEPKNVSARFYLRNAYWERAEALGQLGLHDEALASCDKALGLDDRDQGDQIRLTRATALARSGDVGRALAEADALAEAATIPAGTLEYDLARIDALASAAALEDPATDPAGRERRAESLAALAVRRLDRARGSEEFVPLQVVHIRTSPDFRSLRSRPDFRALLLDLAMPADPFVSDRDPSGR